MQGSVSPTTSNKVDLDRIIDNVEQRLRDKPAFPVTFERPLVRPEAIALVPRPIEPVMAIRAAIREAMSDAMDGGPVPEADTFQPHLSLALQQR